MCAFFNFFVERTKKSFFLERVMFLNCTFPAWLLTPGPRPTRTSFSFGSVIGPIPRGGTFKTSWGCPVDFLSMGRNLKLEVLCFIFGLSRIACPTFLIASASPISNHILVPLSSFKKRPGGSMVRISFTTPAAMCAFFNLFVEGAKYSFFLERVMSLNCTFPSWLSTLPPRPQRTSFSFGSVIGPIPRGGTFKTGRGMER